MDRMCCVLHMISRRSLDLLGRFRLLCPANCFDSILNHYRSAHYNLSSSEISSFGPFRCVSTLIVSRQSACRFVLPDALFRARDFFFPFYFLLRGIFVLVGLSLSFFLFPTTAMFFFSFFLTSALCCVSLHIVMSGVSVGISFHAMHTQFYFERRL